MWYEHQPFRWILENLSSRQITNIIVGLFLIGLFLGSYHVYLDTVQSMESNPVYSTIFRNIIILIIVLFLILVLFTFYLD